MSLQRSSPGQRVPRLRFSLPARARSGECTSDIGAHVRRWTRFEVHTNASASCCLFCSCGAAAGSAVTFRGSRPLSGATPPLGMPRSASGRVDMCTPMPFSAGVAPDPSVPSGKAVEQPRKAATSCTAWNSGANSPGSRPSSRCVCDRQGTGRGATDSRRQPLPGTPQKTENGDPPENVR